MNTVVAFCNFLPESSVDIESTKTSYMHVKHICVGKVFQDLFSKILVSI